MSIKKLPIKYPLITSYPEHANLFAVLQNNENSLSWILNNYIQIYIEIDNPLRPFFYRHFNFDICPYTDYQKIGRDIVSKKWNEFTEFVTDALEMGYYIFVYLDTFYINASSSYKKIHFEHPTLIWGYDSIKGTINTADFYKDCKYIFTYDSFQNINQAFKSTPNKWSIFWARRYVGHDDVILYRNREDCEYTFDIKLVVTLLQDFILSKNTYEKLGSYESQYFRNKKCVFGISIYNSIKNYLQGSAIQIEFIPPTVFSILLDHKVLMVERIKYLGNNGYLMNVNTYLCLYEDILLNTRILLNLCLKFNLTHNIDIINRIISMIPLLEEKERYACNLLLDELSNYLENHCR